MKPKTAPRNAPPEEVLENLQAIKNCLEYLAIEAARADLEFVSHLIGVAAEAIQDSINIAEKSRSAAKVLGNASTKGNGSCRGDGEIGD